MGAEGFGPQDIDMYSGFSGPPAGIGNMGMMGPTNMPQFGGVIDGAMGPPSLSNTLSQLMQGDWGALGQYNQNWNNYNPTTPGMDIQSLMDMFGQQTGGNAMSPAPGAANNNPSSGQPNWDSLFGDTPGDPNTSGLPGSLFGIPEMPSMWNALGGLQPYNIPNLPQFDYEGMDPTLRASIERPYGQALDMARERLGGAGMLGTQGRENPMFSGAAGQVLGEMGQQAGPVMAQQAYNMTMPNQMQEWQANLGRNMTGYNTGLQALGTDYGGEMQRRGEYMNQMNMPFQILPQMMGGTYSTPMVQQGSQSNTSGALGGGLMGAAIPMLMGGTNPLTSILMGLGGFLGGL